MAGGATGGGWAATPSLVIHAGMVISLPRPRPAMFAARRVGGSLLAAKKSFLLARYASSFPPLCAHELPRIVPLDFFSPSLTVTACALRASPAAYTDATSMARRTGSTGTR